MLMVDDDEKIAFLSRAALGRPHLQGDPSRQAGQRVQPRRGRWPSSSRTASPPTPSDPTSLAFMGRVQQLLDESVAAQEYLIPEQRGRGALRPGGGGLEWHCEEAFKQGRPRTAAQRLRSLLSARITALVRLNPVRVDLVERFEKLVADYNAGSINTETVLPGAARRSAETLTEEEARFVSPRDLTEEQLAIFDLLMRPAPELSEDEKVAGEEGGRGTARRF